LTLHVAINSFSHFSTNISLQGAALINGPPALVGQLYEHISVDSFGFDDGNYVFPCHTVVPDIVFRFAGVAFSITHSFNLGQWESNPAYCIGSITGVEPDQVWTMGTIFMTDYYTVFDVGNRRVGLADLE
jgi:hypothetical protein